MGSPGSAPAECASPFKNKKGREKNNTENIARSADGRGKAHAWAGGFGQGQDKYWDGGIAT